MKNELNTLSALFEAARHEWGICASNPARGVRRPTSPAGRTRRLEPGEQELLLRACRTSRAWYLPAFVTLSLETGARLGELAQLRWEQVDLETKAAHLPDTKNGTARDIPLSTRAVDALQSLPRQINGSVFPVRAGSIKQAFRGAVRAAQAKFRLDAEAGCRVPLEDLRLHDLRHEAVSRLFERGLNVLEVASISGHKTVAMLKRYTHLRAADLADKLG